MPYGEIRVDTITFTNAGVDKSITVSGLFASTSGNLTVTGTVSGTTFTGTTANFTSGNVTTFSGGTCTITSGVFASGTATNPSISFIADSNTGLYSPGADQFAIATSGIGRLFVNSSGSVGIGTTSPSQELDVSGNIRSVSGGSNEVLLVGVEGAIELSRSDSGSYIDFKTTNLEDFDCRIQQSSNGLVFSTGGNGATSERLRINSSGSVGIGTSSPNYKLDVSGGVLTPGHFTSTVDWNFSNLILRRNASNVSTAKMLSMMLQGDTDSDTTLTNYLNIWGTYSAAPTTGSTTAGLSGVMNLGAPSGIALHVNGSQRAFIDSGGDVLIGQSTNPATSRVVIQVRTGTANGVNAQITSDTGTSYPWSNYNTSGTYIGGISCTSTATSFPTSSDYRLKQNIQPLVNAAALLAQIKPSVFEFKQDPGTQVQGFIAHELQEVVPLAVIGEKDAKDLNGNPMYQGVDAAKLVPLLTAALQEAIVKIEALEIKVAALESV